MRPHLQRLLLPILTLTACSGLWAGDGSGGRVEGYRPPQQAACASDAQCPAGNTCDLARQHCTTSQTQMYQRGTKSPPGPLGCLSKLDCAIDEECVRVFGEPGRCVIPVDANGMRVIGPPPSPFPQGRQCWSIAECPIFFRCENGLCVR